MTRFISFYLPQYHPIPENDDWWGKGFTDWINVSSGRPRFRGHYQPHLPADLGFYDLRLSATRLAQANLAREFGIGGFCYYHYWFNGKLLLEQPLREVLAERKPDFPFCMCWANENWTRAWDGLDRDVLLRQSYPKDDIPKHFSYLVDYFKDDRYIKVRGCPMFLIYRCDHIPDLENYLTAWRTLARNAGFPNLYLCATTNGFTTSSERDIIRNGFDAVIDFQPNREDFPTQSSLSHRLVRIARKTLPGGVYQRLKLHGSMANRISYRKLMEAKIQARWPTDYVRYPCVFPSWDNTPRRKTPTVIQNTSPQDYGRWLRYAARTVLQYPNEQRFVFINAWNEWAEGCHLEPDRHLGAAFLDETKKVILDANDSL